MSSIDFTSFLKLMAQKKASDLFITAGVPPSIKVQGKVSPITQSPLTPQQSRDMVLEVMSPSQREEFEKTHECNFAIGAAGIGAIIGQRLNLTQSTPHGPGSGLCTVNAVKNRLGLRFHFRQNGPKSPKFGFDSAKHLPDLAGALFERQGSETHLQRVKHRHQSGRTDKRHAVLTLQGLHQAGDPQNLGIQALCWEEHHGEVRGVRRLNIFFAD